MPINLPPLPMYIIPLNLYGHFHEHLWEIMKKFMNFL